MDHFESHETLIVSIPERDDSISAVTAFIHAADILRLCVCSWERTLGAKCAPEVTASKKKLRGQCHCMGMKSTNSLNEEENHFFLGTSEGEKMQLLRVL